MNHNKMDELMHLTQTVRRLEAAAKRVPTTNNMRMVMEATVALKRFNLNNNGA